jgi:Ca2+-binding RTX toxin-like protein
LKKLIMVIAGSLALAFPAGASAGHGLELLDHPGFPFDPPAQPASSTFNSGGPDAEWELVTTIPTGNPHTDIDFFTQGGDTFASVGTLGTGPNNGGQTIVRLTQGGAIDPEFLAGHGSASCLSNPADVTGLQHDVEATPKGKTLLNSENPFADRSDAQLLIDATDAPGRCHDQGQLGLRGVPQGGLELIDVTDPTAPKEIGLISHIGESHTVNVDPKRPHIVYSVTSDTVGVNADGSRSNESGSGLNLDGFEVADISSCMNFPAGTTLEQKRAQCRPQVFRYRYPSARFAQGHTLKDTIYACHELEVYPDDRLTCASGTALVGLDMSGAFDDNGTPDDFSDDRPNGTPLPCAVRDSSSAPPFTSGAKVTDCVDGQGGADLSVPGWLAGGAPSLEGVRHIGSIHHAGRASTGDLAPFDSDEDIDFNHEAELSASGNLLLATDERGGGILPPGASCSPGVDNPQGNGGVHFFRTDALHGGGPGTAEAEQAAYATTPEGERAIFRVPIRTQPRATICTAHVFHQIPGQNRIVMAWYSQGTHIIDFLERPDGTVEFKEVGYFIPENANEWVSAAFDAEANADGTQTLLGATGDFSLGESGRNAIDVWKVTLPPAPSPAAGPGVGAGPTGGGSGSGGSDGGSGGGAGPAGDACPNVMNGGRGGESLVGTSFGDTIRARGGRDRVRAGRGDDCVFGGKGKDALAGNGGGDTIGGGKGADRVNGGAGADTVRVRGGGRDRVRCGPGEDVAVVDRKDRARDCEKLKRPRT